MLECMSTTGGSLRPLLAVILFRKTVFVHDCQLSVDLAPVPDWHAPFFRCFEGCKVQGFQERLPAGTLGSDPFEPFELEWWRYYHQQLLTANVCSHGGGTFRPMECNILHKFLQLFPKKTCTKHSYCPKYTHERHFCNQLLTFPQRGLTPMCSRWHRRQCLRLIAVYVFTYWQGYPT